jgi:hypothetical protein
VLFASCDGSYAKCDGSYAGISNSIDLIDLIKVLLMTIILYELYVSRKKCDFVLTLGKINLTTI